MARRWLSPSTDNHTESYLESLSDLLIGFLFIFMIILMSFSLNLKIAQEEHRAAERRLSDAGHLRNNLLTAMRSRLSREGVFIDIDQHNGILRLPESLLFSSGSADFSKEGREKVAIVANELASELPCYALGPSPGRRCPDDAHAILDAVFIEGHSDSVPITGGPFKDNWDLSAARSRHTYQALVQSAPALQKIWNGNGQPLLSISAYGDTRPLTQYRTIQENQAHSRRIDLRFIVGAPKVQDLEAGMK